MAKPWDLKLTHELSEWEMLDYVRHMEAEDHFHKMEEIEQLVERCVQHWHRLREDSTNFPFMYHSAPMTRGWVGELDSYPEASYTFREKVVKVYPWMEEKQVRYLARMQLEEQWDS